MSANWRQQSMSMAMAMMGAQRRRMMGKKLARTAMIFASIPLMKEFTDESAQKKAAYKAAKIAEQHPNENFPVLKPQIPLSPMSTMRSTFDGRTVEPSGRGHTDNPFIIIGVILTGCAIVYMMIALKKNDQKLMLKAAKYRVIFQAMTFASCALGAAFYSYKGNGKDADGDN